VRGGEAPTWGGVRESVLDSSSGLANARRVTANSPVGTAGLTLGGILPTEALMVDARKCGRPGHREAVAGKALDESSPAPAPATIGIGDLDRRGPVAKDARHVAQTTYDRPAGASPGRPVGTSPRPALGRAWAALETTRRGGWRWDRPARLDRARHELGANRGGPGNAPLGRSYDPSARDWIRPGVVGRRTSGKWLRQPEVGALDPARAAGWDNPAATGWDDPGGGCWDRSAAMGLSWARAGATVERLDPQAQTTGPWAAGFDPLRWSGGTSRGGVERATGVMRDRNGGVGMRWRGGSRGARREVAGPAGFGRDHVAPDLRERRREEARSWYTRQGSSPSLCIAHVTDSPSPDGDLARAMSVLGP
jgi:hypothetical protein